MAQPFDVEGAMKSALRPLGRIAIPFLTPSTRAVRLVRSQSSARPALPCSSGMRQCDSTGIRRASGNRARISRPRANPSTAGSR